MIYEYIWDIEERVQILETVSPFATLHFDLEIIREKTTGKYREGECCFVSAELIFLGNEQNKLIRGSCCTCVSAFLEIHQSLQCRIFQYTFLRQYPNTF